MKKLIILTAFLTVCSARINITIKTSNYVNRTKVNFKGTDIKLVTDEEVALFNITHDNLNRGIRIEMGRVPNDIFLRDPTPYDNLFNEFEWPEVGRILYIKSAKIIDFIKEEIVLKTHEHINNTTVSIKSKTDMLDTVENSVMSVWFASGLPKDLIDYGVNIDFGYANWSFIYKWRDTGLKFIHLPFGTTKGIVDLESGHKIVSKLLGTKITMLIEIQYIAKLIGNIIADYENLYGKYHFYSPALANIMRAANLKNEIFTKEYLLIKCYINPRIEVFDKDIRE